VPVWVRGEGDYIARGLVAPVLAGDDGSWERTYGTRAVDYQARPQPWLRLTRRTRNLCGWYRTFAAVTAGSG